MILREICISFEKRHEMPFFKERDFNLKINHIVDSIYLRMPRSVKTESVGKLNVCIDSSEPIKEFWAVDGIGMAFVPSKKKNELPFLDKVELFNEVISLMKKGIQISSKYDAGIKEHLQTIYQCLDESVQPFYYFRKIKRSHKSRKYKAEGIVHIQPDKYISQILISDKAGNFERISIEEVEPLLECVDLGFDKLLWEGDVLVGYSGDTRRFEVTPKLIGN